jgi:RNA polymerase sigma factor (sigma-70 family)
MERTCHDQHRDRAHLARPARHPALTDAAEHSEQVSLAMLLLLETLSPTERAVFVLREVFGMPFAEVAGALDRSEAAVRQTAHRAREHVQARRPRFDADRRVQRRSPSGSSPPARAVTWRRS